MQEKNHGKDEGALLRTLHRVLEATLRDVPAERKKTSEVVKIFREQKIFHQDGAR